MGSPLIVETGPGRFVAIWPNGTKPPHVIRFKFNVEGEKPSTSSALIQAVGEFAISQTVGYFGLSTPFQAFLVTAIQAKLFGLPAGVWVCYRVAIKVGEAVRWFFKG